ncbi:hypothetical protein [Alteromonas macleodii]|uniref:ParA family protein n=1 Tax=Alteromonas macleodii TaxID=28108 RepID=UPI002FF81B3C
MYTSADVSIIGHPNRQKHYCKLPYRLFYTNHNAYHSRCIKPRCFAVLTFSLFGTIERLLENAMELKEDLNPELRLLGIVVNQFNSQAKLPRELIETLKQQDLPVLESYISATVKVKESHSKRMPLPFYLPKHKVTNQIAALFEELNASKT